MNKEEVLELLREIEKSDIAKRGRVSIVDNRRETSHIVGRVISVLLPEPISPEEREEIWQGLISLRDYAKQKGAWTKLIDSHKQTIEILSLTITYDIAQGIRRLS